MAGTKVADMTREELEAESASLAKDKSAIKERERQVNLRLDAYRELDRLNIPPERLQEIARIAKVESKGETEAKQA